MIPIGDDNRDRTITPYVNYILIAINILVFVLFQGAGSNQNFTYAFATVPAEIVSGQDVVTADQVVQDPASGQQFVLPGLQPTPISVYITLFTAMFMHGGWAHLGGNMLYLWIFGDNLEDRLGHGRYLIFYLTAGLLASLAHVFASVLVGDNLQIPSLGASGAIAGVLGGYLVLFPRRRITVLVMRIVTQVNAFIAVGLWFVLQLVGGLGTLSGSSDGVAYAAHIGGFIAGVVLIKLFAAGREPAARFY
ncbi:MAG: rhomboid family intramembrane serine protease [Ardenticatenaceae bacterium]|nr:rhomboid family intramembrane serine protease [Ardenticatenaceae bacterium]MCB9446683.1 rhomboid family intramembrane serine protease [Ardenticatenaceae bacterium]